MTLSRTFELEVELTPSLVLLVGVEPRYSMYEKQLPYHYTAFLILEMSSSNKAPGDAAETVVLDLHMMAYKWCSERKRKPDLSCQ